MTQPREARTKEAAEEAAGSSFFNAPTTNDAHARRIALCALLRVLEIFVFIQISSEAFLLIYIFIYYISLRIQP